MVLVIKKNRALQILAIFLILLFSYTASHKLAELPTFRFVLSQSPWVGDYASSISIMVPLLELIIVGLLILPCYRRTGFFFSFSLMLLFTVYTACLILSPLHLPCSCGWLFQKMSWEVHVVFNLVVSALSFWAWREDDKNVVTTSNHYSNNQAKPKT